MKAVYQGRTIAEADKSELIRIEGNWYFPPSSLDHSLVRESTTHTTCPWKGVASYYDVVVDDDINRDAAWYYPAPLDGAVGRVGKDFGNYLAFWRGVEIIE